LGDLDNRSLFFLVLEARKSKTKVPEDLVSSEDSLAFRQHPSLNVPTYGLSLVPALKEGGKERDLSLPLLIRAFNPIVRV
jgi:hypothetical protein